ncbi:MAG: hypothetical protein AAF744_04340 [Pseudomonadota bacterium]
MSGATLTPLTATAIFVAAVFFGYRYRATWKEEGPAWLLWVYGVLTAVGFLVLGFTPMDVSG